MLMFSSLRRFRPLRLLAVRAGLAILIGWLGLTPASAQFSSGDLVQQIRVDGAERVDPDTVRSYLTIKVGEPFDPQRMNESLKRLFETGYFADVKLVRDGGTLVVDLVENPIINRIAFEGNRKVEDKALEAEAQLRPRVVYTRTRVQNDVKRILDIYRRQGYFGASVEPKIIQLDQNRVDLVFEIDEGSETTIERIVFIGNKRFSDSQLRSVISTKESAWYRFFSSDDVYDPDRVSFDRERLRQYYLENGYADFRVASAVAELSPDKSGFILTFSVEEGERYRFADIEIVSKLPDLQTDSLTRFVVAKPGGWYNSKEVETTVDNITDEVGRVGYAFVDVRPRVRRDRENRTVAVAFEIGEGPRVYVDRIEIEGNVRTLDRVIRREFRLVEGDAFNTAKLRRSRQRIRNLGYFDKVEVDNVQSDQPDRTTVKVEVQEQSTGELSLGAGFSTTEGVLGDVSIRERNLLGKGQDLRAGVQVSQRRQQIDLSFTEPYFLERNLSAGIDVFHIERDNRDESSFDIRSTGFSLRAGYQITEPLTQQWKYTLRQDDIEPGEDASRFVKAEAGAAITSSIGQDLVYDKRDNRFEPSEGYLLSLSNTLAGLGGDKHYFSTEARAAQYFPLGGHWVLGFGAKVGYIVGIGEDVGLNERFNLGGNSFRGFDQRGVGPRDSATDDALGGNYYVTGSTELTFPLGLPDELGFKGQIFSDVGTLGGIDESGGGIQDSNSIRASVGVGVSWKSPFGPIRVDVAQPILKESYDKTRNIFFSFGTRF